jgi:hypothetical protein
MSLIRRFELEDIEIVARLYQRTFGGSARNASAALVDCLKGFYLDGPVVDPDITSLVHVGDNGAISGFLGVNVVPMAFSGRTLKAAFCGALMVENHDKQPLAGARLLKAFLSGRQDLSLSETANKTSLEMSKALRGRAFAGYSLEWMRAFTPAAFACDMVFRHSRLRNGLLPVARGLDGLVRRTGIGRRLALEQTGAGKVPLATRVADPNEFADIVEPLTAHYRMRPCWAPADLRHVLAQAFAKPRYGEAVARIVAKGDGPPIGAFLYHLQPGGVGRVFQVLALPGKETAVIDSMFADAVTRGAAGLRGRTQPALLDGLLGKGAIFANASSTVVFSNDDDILESFRSGKAFVNGIAGENWGRHIGGDFG